MPRVCKFTGKKTATGMTRTYRGQKISKGGFGLKPTGITKRTFKPNLQKVNAMIDGRPQKVRVSTKAIKSGLIVKPLKRKYGYTRLQKQGAAA
ncbi:MAG: 50S ribosomal protein L28 [Phycisphaeraceae bacterium]|nr:50S ribosomal protein L28 [Phycisphaeraceae bacterium]